MNANINVNAIENYFYKVTSNYHVITNQLMERVNIFMHDCYF